MLSVALWIRFVLWHCIQFKNFFLVPLEFWRKKHYRYNQWKRITDTRVHCICTQKDAQFMFHCGNKRSTKEVTHDRSNAWICVVFNSFRAFQATFFSLLDILLRSVRIHRIYRCAGFVFSSRVFTWLCYFCTYCYSRLLLPLGVLHRCLLLFWLPLVYCSSLYWLIPFHT